jgi:hypothetical protein
MAVSHSVVLYEPTETSAEVVTAAGFLAGYSGRTRPPDGVTGLDRLPPQGRRLPPVTPSTSPLT